MTELEARLQALADEVEYPATPDLLEGIAGRLAPRPARRRGLRLAVALAVVVAAAAAVLAASPGARSAFVELFHLPGATISRVDALPPAEAVTGRAPGTPLPLAEAQRLAGFRVRIPHTRAGAVREALLDRERGVVSLTWCCPPLVLTQFAGEAVPFVQKLVQEGTTVERVDVDGRPGYWISGAPHVVLFRSPDGAFHDYQTHVAGDVLLWVDGEVTLRLEGQLTKGEALELAATVR